MAYDDWEEDDYYEECTCSFCLEKFDRSMFDTNFCDSYCSPLCKRMAEESMPPLDDWADDDY